MSNKFLNYFTAWLFLASLVSLAAFVFSKFEEDRLKKKAKITCESKGEVLESFTYNEDKKQIIIQCLR